ncbi:hypothetical protein IU494_30295 [Nocardia terpenica]|uniref:hypothetical protein n=1 Tax=Nocardia terpenica TaxID=455432 RepID=UPI0018958EB7|nr:hypothetical protein [Nocardia terpenica]MBF6064939.1 hypothetical protein [Nocardia terpenica]MBF6115211.1 hypothetical protein [Nocardia terpenica]MBF6122533.1 hypothetical protein [Nocardia terpenica]
MTSKPTTAAPTSSSTSARTAGRADEADRIAAVLRARFGHDPAPAGAPTQAVDAARRGRGTKARAAAEPPPETTAAG